MSEGLVRIPPAAGDEAGGRPVAGGAPGAPPGSPDRTAFLVDRIVGAADAMSRGDLEELLRYYHPDVEILIAQLDEGGLWGGDFDESYHGQERFLALTRQWLEAWDDLRLEPEELLDEGGNTFSFIATWVGRGSGSGVEVTTSYQARQTMIGDRIARVEFWADRETALRALGLEP